MKGGVVGYTDFESRVVAFSRAHPSAVKSIYCGLCDLAYEVRVESRSEGIETRISNA